MEYVCIIILLYKDMQDKIGDEMLRVYFNIVELIILEIKI